MTIFVEDTLRPGIVGLKLINSIDIAGFEEEVRDTVAAFLTQGTNISLVHDDEADTLTISATGGAGGLDAEGVRDTVAAFTVAGDGISIVHDDAADTLTISVTNVSLLDEFAEANRMVFNEKIDTEAVIRFWFRENSVTSANINDPGVGLVISEANGDLSEDGDTYQDDMDHENELLYMSIDTAYLNNGGADLTNKYVVFKEGDTVIQAIQISSGFTNLGTFGLAGNNTFFELTSGGLGGQFAQYHSGQTIEVFVEATEQFFEIPESNADNVDLTRGVKDLPETALDNDVIGKLNAEGTLPYDDQFKLDQLVEVTTNPAISAADDGSTIYWKYGGFSTSLADYFVSDFGTGLPPNLNDTTTTYIALVPHQYTLTEFTGPGGESGTVTAITPSIRNFNAYRVSVTPTTNAENFILPIGTVLSISEIDLSDLIKVDRNNLTQALKDDIDNDNPSGNVDSARLTAVESKVAALFPLTPDVSDLTQFADIYDPLRPVTEVRETQGYSLFVDYRGKNTRYESDGVVFDASNSNVVRYTGLSSNLHRTFGFKVDGPSAQVLMWLLENSVLIPYVDMTAGGNFRVNNYTIAHIAGTPVSDRITFVDRDSGSQLVSDASDSNAGFTIPAIPTGATNVSRTAEFDVDIYSNGVDTSAGGFIRFAIPVPDAVQDRQTINHTFNLGPLHGNRIININFEYRFVTSPAFRLIMTLESAPSDISVDFKQLELLESYTPADTVSRVDNFVNLQDQNGDFTFTGEQELLISFFPRHTSRTLSVVPVVIDSSGTIDELNDQTTPIPDSNFSAVEIPDQTNLSGFEFRTFESDHFLTHDDLSHLIVDRAIQWCYGLARNITVSTQNAISQPIDLAEGSTIGGNAIASGAITSVYEATGLGSGVGELVSSVVLPLNYNTFDYVHISEYDVTNLQWRHAVVKVSILDSGLIDTNQNIRLQGNTAMSWDQTSRTLTMAGNVQEIYSVELVNI